MRKLIQKRRNWEWVLGGGMLLLCIGLSVLQYRWTGEMARSEAARMKGNLTEQVQALVREFESELSTSCDQLKPEKAEFGGQTVEAVHATRYQEWKTTGNRPMFGRLALGLAEGTTVTVKLLDPASGEFKESTWPPEWRWLRDSLQERLRGGKPPSVDRQGMVLEFPVFKGGGPEHWLILELDRNYLRQRWLPELIEKHLTPSGTLLNDVRVLVDDGPRISLYQTSDSNPTGERVTLRLNRAGRTEKRSRLPLQSNGAWLIEAWPRPGALEAVVERSQRRNIALALCLNLLMLCTGFALIHYAGKSRDLAERQLQFVATVSHELRTPLTVIRGAGQNLLRGVVRTPEDLEAYHRLILRHADHLKELVDQTLAMAGSGREVSSAKSAVDLPSLVQESMNAVAEEVRGHGCELEWRCEEQLPAVQGDPGALRRVFQNLISNAAKHGGAGGWIGIQLGKGTVHRTGAEAVVVSVMDRGEGIPPAELDRVFEPFFRGAAAHSKHVRGSGLGLSVVRTLVEEHSGEVQVTSRVGQGSTFEVRLPTIA